MAKITEIKIGRIDGTHTRHFSHLAAAKELAKSRKAQVIWIHCRERSGKFYNLSEPTMIQEIAPRINKRDVSGLMEVLEILSF